MRQLIVFLIRIRLGLRKYQHFRFKNQKSSTEFYWFTSDGVMKQLNSGIVQLAGVSLNWLLSKDCEIVLCDTEQEVAREKST